MSEPVPDLLEALADQLADEVERRVLQRLATHERERDEPDSPFLSVKEAATFLRTSEARIHNLLSAGVLRRAGKDGRRVLLDRREVERYCQQAYK